jgi:hypothetical protein
VNDDRDEHRHGLLGPVLGAAGLYELIKHLEPPFPGIQLER